MKIKFNLFERVAGLFVLGAIVLSFAITIGMGIKKGWFDPKVTLVIEIDSADGLNPGTGVRFSGLRIGSVNTVELKAGGQVEVRFKVLKRYAERLNADSVVYVVRPFVIGEKELKIENVNTVAPPVKEGQVLSAVTPGDFLEMLGSNKIGAYIESFGAATENLQKLAEAFLSDERTDDIIKLFDEITPLMAKMNSMATEVSTLSASLNEKQKMARVLDDVLVMSKQLKKALPAVSKDMPALTTNILTLTENLNQLSSDMKEIVPVFKQIAPEIPAATKKATAALDEVVLTLKAMQKTWFLRSNVEDVKEEEMKLRMRQPASQ
jgi:phospholipid/cholesterol/gamma-HCH transport system substrate-binding protein